MTGIGSLWCDEMVLEQTPWRCRHLGGVRDLQDGRTWYAILNRMRGDTRADGNLDSDMARDAFSTFIPIGGDSDARTNIILDFFDLLAAIAAHGKSNGLGGRKLSRYAGWWAFEHVDTGNGFEAAYKNWAAYGFP
jgi:Domain of unknown function (DUF1708).